MRSESREIAIALSSRRSHLTLQRKRQVVRERTGLSEIGLDLEFRNRGDLPAAPRSAWEILKKKRKTGDEKFPFVAKYPSFSAHRPRARDRSPFRADKSTIPPGHEYRGREAVSSRGKMHFARRILSRLVEIGAYFPVRGQEREEQLFPG